jgi:hypothetical protein
MKKALFAILAFVLLGFSTLVSARMCATGDLHYYVATGGSDLNDGSSSAPWETPSHAAAWVQTQIDLCGHNVTFHLSGDGCRPFAVTGPFVGALSAASVTFLGNVENPTLCTISAVGGNAIAMWENAAFRIRGLQLIATGCISDKPTSGIVVSDSRLYLTGVWFGYACWAHIHAIGNMTRVSWIGIEGGNAHITIIGNAPIGFLAEDKSQVNLNNATIHYYAAVEYSKAFAWADQASLLDFTGAAFVYNGFSVSGQRYVSEQAALIRTGGHVLPGDVGGITQTYGLVHPEPSP